MAYYFSNGSYRTLTSNWPPSHNQLSLPETRSKLVSDNIRPSSVYVESSEDIAPGHVVQWTGSANNFMRNGTREVVYSSSNGHEYAMSSVEPATTHSTTVAGVVIEKAAGPTDTSYTHKGGVHTSHTLPADSGHILRVGRGIALAWVLDSHHGELEGIYTRYVNGVEDSTGPYQLRMTARDQFTIERTTTATAELQLASLTARFDALVSE